ncbi:MAG TPA: hypothetical protein VE775_03960, partial [Pyrinomonadaceae bacterium]|nr:hypothetical protein [Pyrinomonadaceae bacterium]
MRKLLVVCLTAALLLTALLLPQLTGAARKDKDKPGGRTPAVPGKGAGRQETGASKSDGNPLMYRAVNFGESGKLSDIAQAQTKLKNQRSAKVLDREKMIEQKREKTGRSEAEINEQRSLSAAGVRTEDEAREKNDRNREIIRHLDPAAPSTPDSALAKVPAGEKGRGFAPQVLPVPNVSFEGISEVNTEAIGQGFIPPDTNGEIGPSHFVQTVNVGLRIYNRNGTPATALTTIGALFAALPGVCANTNDGDPIVLYDQLADRWLISQFCWSVAVPNHQIIAISKTGDPTGAYYLYDFVMPNVKFNDYPHLGMWPDGYYMTDNQFNQAGTIFQGAGIFAFDRAKMLAGDPTANFIYFSLGLASFPEAIGGMLPSDMDGLNPPPPGRAN